MDSPRRSLRLLQKRQRDEETFANKRQKNTSIWLSLPTELFWYILEFIQPNENIHRLTLVCQQWNNEMQSEMFWSMLYNRWFGGRLNNSSMSTNFQEASRIWAHHSSSQQTWFWAATVGHIKLIKYLHQDLDINIKNNENRTALYIACMHNQPLIIQYLIDNGVIIDSKRLNGATPLHSAAWNGHLDILNILIEAKADVNTIHTSGSSALHSASWKGHLDVTRRLIQAGANVNAARNDQVTPIYEASWQGNHEVVQLLLNSNANINIRRNDGLTPLCAASQQGRLNIVQTLINYQADIHLAAPNGLKAIHTACLHGYLEIVKVLCEAGATGTEITRINCAGQSASPRTPYQLAILKNHQPIIQYLRQVRKAFVAQVPPQQN